MKVVLGLGNPGKEYALTRHNVGWWVVDHLADVWRFNAWRKDGEAMTATGRVGEHQVRLVKPLTYMNLSGPVLRPYQRRAFWDPTYDLLVVLDEVALPLGTFRLRARGSAGGHNGLKSVEGQLRTQDYARLRVGIGPDDPRRRGDLADFVLDRFGAGERDTVRTLMEPVRAAVETWLREGIDKAMSLHNRAGAAP
ncbi:MAG TPA: aminoacyl-tRNA hydrolase [Gemmatimonadaceae bacterium]|nr:aminoacyl-tRNA hydrolase [Gemmatimonadaceae bacterium]